MHHNAVQGSLKALSGIRCYFGAGSSPLFVVSFILRNMFLRKEKSFGNSHFKEEVQTSASAVAHPVYRAVLASILQFQGTRSGGDSVFLLVSATLGTDYRADHCGCVFPGCVSNW
jgi:hypothetical protein